MSVTCFVDCHRTGVSSQGTQHSIFWNDFDMIKEAYKMDNIYIVWGDMHVYRKQALVLEVAFQMCC